MERGEHNARRAGACFFAIGENGGGAEVKAAGIALVVLLALSAYAHGAAGAGDKPSAEEILRKAMEASDIRAPGSPSFRLEATVEVTLAGEKTPVMGTYQLLWISEKKWREEITFPNFHQVRVGDATSYWQVRSPNSPILQIEKMSAMIDFPVLLANVLSDPGFKPKAPTKKSGELCAEGRQAGMKNIICVGGGDGLLARREYKPMGPGVSKNPTEEYSQYQPFHGKQYPRSMETLEGNKSIGTISVSRLEDYHPADFSAFSTPAGAELWDYCRQPTDVKVLESSLPVYPREEMRSNGQGSVVLDVEVAADGSVRNATVLISPGPAFTSATLDAVKKWKYAPARCGAKAIREEVTVEVEFRRGP